MSATTDLEVFAYELQRSALEYSRMGVAILPLRPQQKLPIIKGCLLRATSDEEMIRFYWAIGSRFDQATVLQKINDPIHRRLAQEGLEKRERARLMEALLTVEDLGSYRNPIFNIGILTGKRNGITVLDKDVKEYDLGGGRVGTGKMAWDLLLKTHGAKPFWTPLQVRTTSGGDHYYYKHHPGAPNRARLFSENDLRGIDCRNDGGFVVAPPSKIEKADEDGYVQTIRYRWRKLTDSTTGLMVPPKIDFESLPAFPDVVVERLEKEALERERLRELIETERKDDEFEDREDEFEDEEGEYAPQSLGDCIAYLRTFDLVPHGTRNTETKRTCYYIGGKFRLLPYEEQLEALIWWNENRCVPPQALNEIEPVLIWSLNSREFDEENGHAWIKPRKLRVADPDLPPVERVKKRFGRISCRNIVAINDFIRDKYPDLDYSERSKLLKEIHHG